MTTMSDISHDAAYAALCMWEEIIQPNLPDAPQPWSEMRDQIGHAELHSAVLALGEACNKAWSRAHEAHQTAWEAWEAKRRKHEDEGKPFLDKVPPDTSVSFDWDFVPSWMRLAVDWSDLDNGPRVRGSGAV